MRYYILAGGSGTRWNNYKGRDKCLLLINGEMLLDRTVRLLLDNGVEAKDIIICGNEAVRDGIYLDDSLHIAADAEFEMLGANSKREAFEMVGEMAKGPFAILLGDTYYTEAIIKDIVERPVKKWAHWFNPNPNKYTGCPWSEGYCHKVMDWEWWNIQMRDFNARVRAGEIEDGRDYAINGFLEDRPMNMIYFHDFSYMSDVDIYWNDETDDFDFPEDYDRFIERFGKPLGVELSVVIPTFNNSETLRVMLAKLLKQSAEQALYNQVEIVVIDDGSTEDMHWLNKLGITVIHKPNGGVSSARNVGMRAAVGKYIAFVDSDDEILDNYLPTIWRELQEHKDEGVDIFDFKAKCEDGSDMFHWGTVWPKVFRREFILDVPFDETLNSGEDGRWFKQLETKMRSTIKTPETIYFYHWSANPNSLCKRVNRGELPKEKSNV